jgi:hypothetical protein
MTAATQKKVHKVMHEHKKGTLKKRLGQEGAQPEAGGRHCHVRIRPIEEGKLTTQARTRSDPMPTESSRPATWFSTCQTGGMA